MKSAQIILHNKRHYQGITHHVITKTTTIQQ